MADTEVKTLARARDGAPRHAWRKFPIRMHFRFELVRFPSTHAENRRPDSVRNCDNSSTRYFTDGENFGRRKVHAMKENAPTCHSRLMVVCPTTMRFNAAC
jgi:hypothetical protein